MTAKREPPIGLRPTPDERALWTEAATAMGNTLSGFMRWGINRAALQVVTQAARPPTCTPAPNLCDDPTGCTDPREDCAEVLGVARGEGGD